MAKYLSSIFTILSIGQMMFGCNVWSSMNKKSGCEAENELLASEIADLAGMTECIL